ncbi:hypothetical protein AOL_s00043g239 [Orbilia oligospora ATCC 24927]|uniref:PA14 domain-containing protein n=1 Tax=Arthrobotrys oligospora (strain ATCC 24927 / CBS 115.81 / DSM 1491) TaxID=756982 RepID=G1X3G6_ARTOA|nr:hypothetical protein AOL_s00043g239 [Orbilia oligospora ATCC 24927]EGX52450.1 hypothetical protein AOL_s00043g239 [Orbilia oligospora ATCC 24927]
MAAPRRDKLSFLLLSLILFLSFFDTTSSIPQREVTPTRFHDTSIITKWKWKTSTTISIKYSYRAVQISTVTSADTGRCKGYPIPTTLQHALTIKVCEKCPIQTITNFRDPITSHAEPWVYGRTTILQWWVIEFWGWAFQNFQTAVYHVSQHGKPRKWTSYTIGITLKTLPMTTLGVLTTYNTTSFIHHRTRVTVHNLEGEYRSTIQVTRAPTTITYMKTTKSHTTVYITVTQVVQITEVNTIMDGSGSIIKTTSLLPLPSSITIRCTTKSTHVNREGSTLILMSDIITSIPLAINLPGCTRVYASTSCASPNSAGAQGGPGDEVDSLSSDLEGVTDPLTSVSLQLSTVSRPISSLASGISPRPSSSETPIAASGSTTISISASNPSILQSTVPLSVSSNSDSLFTITSAVTSWYEMVTQTIYSGSTSRTSLTIGADGNPTAIIVLPTGLGGIRFTTVSSGSTVSETTVVGPGGATTIIEIRPITDSQVESRSVGLTVSSVSSTDPLGQSSVEFLTTTTSPLEATDLISTTLLPTNASTGSTPSETMSAASSISADPSTLEPGDSDSTSINLSPSANLSTIDSSIITASTIDLVTADSGIISPSSVDISTINLSSLGIGSTSEIAETKFTDGISTIVLSESLTFESTSTGVISTVESTSEPEVESSTESTDLVSTAPEQTGLVGPILSSEAVIPTTDLLTTKEPLQTTVSTNESSLITLASPGLSVSSLSESPLAETTLPSETSGKETSNSFSQSLTSDSSIVETSSTDMAVPETTSELPSTIDSQSTTSENSETGDPISTTDSTSILSQSIDISATVTDTLSDLNNETSAEPLPEISSNEEVSSTSSLTGAPTTSSFMEEETQTNDALSTMDGATESISISTSPPTVNLVPSAMIIIEDYKLYDFCSEYLGYSKQTSTVIQSQVDTTFGTEIILTGEETITFTVLSTELFVEKKTSTSLSGTYVLLLSTLTEIESQFFTITSVVLDGVRSIDETATQDSPITLLSVVTVYEGVYTSQVYEITTLSSTEITTITILSGEVTSTNVEFSTTTVFFQETSTIVDGQTTSTIVLPGTQTNKVSASTTIISGETSTQTTTTITDFTTISTTQMVQSGILLITSTAPTKTVFNTQSFSTNITSGISILPTIIYTTTINSATASTTLTSGTTISTFISVVTSSVMSNLRSTVSATAPVTTTTFTSLSFIAVAVTSRSSSQAGIKARALSSIGEKVIQQTVIEKRQANLVSNKVVIPSPLETFGTDILISAIIFETVTLIQATSIVSTTRTEFSTIIESQTSTEIVDVVVPETSYTSTIFFTESISMTFTSVVQIGTFSSTQTFTDTVTLEETFISSIFKTLPSTTEANTLTESIQTTEVLSSFLTLSSTTIFETITTTKTQSAILFVSETIPSSTAIVTTTSFSTQIDVDIFTEFIPSTTQTITNFQTLSQTNTLIIYTTIPSATQYNTISPTTTVTSTLVELFTSPSSTSISYSISTVTSQTTIISSIIVPALTQSTTRTSTFIDSLTTVTTYLSTSTSTIAQIATTTITVAQGAPSGNVSYLSIGGINNGTFAISDDAMHLTNNFYAPNTRETFIVTNLGQLYSVTNNYYYGDPTAADNKLFWGFTNQTAGRNYYIAFTSSTNVYQLYLRNTTSNQPFVFCLSTLSSADSNTRAGFHIRAYNGNAQALAQTGSR